MVKQSIDRKYLTKRAAVALLLFLGVAPIAEAQKKPGVGFRLLPGALSCWEDSGSGGNKGCAKVDLSAEPYGPDGIGARGIDNPTLRRLLAQRYKGGDDSRSSAVPQGYYAELRGNNTLALLSMFEAWKRGEDPSQPGHFVFVGRPVDYIGVPTVGEETDLSYTTTRTGSVMRRWLATSGGAPGALAGECVTPAGARTAKTCSADPGKPVLIRLSGNPYRYVVHLQPGGGPSYWQNTLWKEGGGPWYDPGPPAYPSVFGPDPSAAPVEPPPVEPPPVEPPPPVKPEEPEPPVCPALSDEEILRRAGEVLRRMFPPVGSRGVSRFPGQGEVRPAGGVRSDNPGPVCPDDLFHRAVFLQAGERLFPQELDFDNRRVVDCEEGWLDHDRGPLPPVYLHRRGEGEGTTDCSARAA
jgi:hypothetical protein